VLSFFLDGVPVPGAAPSEDSAALRPPTGAAEPPRPTVQRFFPHTPYRENRCSGCHDADSGQLIRPVQEGLCVTCHAKIVSSRFVHGPVAVNDCTVCHHYHAGPLPNLLLADPTVICLDCHDRDELSTGEYHAAMDQRGCTDCHDPHGADNRFFVRGSAP
jgi:predicted CXXCH cytochrome family protein